MEFFERAHVANNTGFSQKDKKADENMKKQLRKMLHGYKNSDNEAIKSAVEPRNEPDDSTSVSGFSDLNITNSTIDEDLSYNTVHSDEAALSSDDKNADNLSSSPLPQISDDVEVNPNDSVSISVTSVSECDEDLESLSDVAFEVHESLSSQDEGKSSPILSLNSSFVEITTAESDSESNGSNSFDTDGLLAAQILNKLKKTGKKGQKKDKKQSLKKDKNRNVEVEDQSSSKEIQYRGPYRPQTDDSSQDISTEELALDHPNQHQKIFEKSPSDSSKSGIILEDEDISAFTELSAEDCLPIKQKKKKKQSKERSGNKYKGPFNPNKKDADLQDEYSDSSSSASAAYKGPYRPLGVHTPEHMQTVEDESSVSDSTESDNSDLSQDSSPFVSVNASDMPCESLGDIIGDYCHPTIRNLPSDINSNFTADSELFAVEDMNVDDVLIEEDADSLVPEVPDDIVLDEIEDVPMESMDIEMDDNVSPQLVDDNLNTSYSCNETGAFSDTLQSEDVIDRASTESYDTTLVNSVRIFYTRKNSCVFVLKYPAEIFIHGKVKVQRLGGKVEVFGHMLKDEIYKIYAPNYNYAQCLKTVENEDSYLGLFGKLTSSGLKVAEAEEIVTTLGDQDAVICMYPLQSKKMDFVEENFTTTDLFSKPSKSIENCFKQASQMLGCSLYLTRPWKAFEEDLAWQQAVLCGTTNSKAIVCGGKGVGKSTFLRYYVNRLLANGPVLVVDLDPGQCEFTPAGNVAATVVTQPLLGPSYTHLKTPEIMLNLGMINTMDNVRRYAAAVQTLITHCSNDNKLRAMPWIINTMGMTNAMGLKFISLIILLAKPTHLLQINSKNPKKRYTHELDARTVKDLYNNDFKNDTLFKDINIHDVDIQYTFLTSRHSDGGVKNNFSLAPRDERYLNFLAYFGDVLSSTESSLLDIVPYEVNLNALYVAVNVSIAEEAATSVLNGKVVALCTAEDPPGRIFALEDKPLVCHGHGLVRGIDWEKGVLFVITPAGDRLATVNTLVYADWVPEIRGTEEHLPAGEPVPYRTASLYQQRHFMFTPKRRFNPLQLLKMSRTA